MTKRQEKTQKKKANQILPINCCQIKRISEVSPAPDTCLLGVCYLCLLNLNCEREMNLYHAVKYLSRKHFFFFSEKKVCVSRWSQGRQLYSSPYWGTDEKHCPLLTDTGASLSEAWCFWGTCELTIHSLLTLPSCIPKGKHNFPHLRRHREVHVLFLLSSPAQTPIYHWGRDWKYSLSLVNIYFAVCHLHCYSKPSPSSLSPNMNILPAYITPRVSTNSYSYCLVQSIQQAASCAWCDHNPFSSLPSPNFLPVFYSTISHTICCIILHWPRYHTMSYIESTLSFLILPNVTNRVKL